MNDERREIINKTIQKKGEVKIKELQEMFPDISTMTIRRDLDYLEEEGAIVRIWGGAKSVDYITESREEDYSSRKTENIEAKIKIARKAVDLIEKRRSIFLDSGTTLMCLAEIIPDKDFSILTSGPNIGLELANKNKPSITIIGGQLNKNNISLSGANSLKFIENINVDIAFMATSGFSLASGFTSGNNNECELKGNIIGKARKVIMLMDLSKLDKDMPFTFAGLEDIDVLVTENELPDYLKEECRAHDVEVLN
ncbi:MAG: DeoR/GlpR family DNA-binding transcription regulator [Bacillota bacterium]